MNLFDAHCHLPAAVQAQPDPSVQPVPNLGKMVERANAAGVVGMAVCFDFSRGWKNRAEFFQALETYPQIFPSFGIHPGSVSNDWKETFQTLEVCCLDVQRFFQGSEKGVRDFPRVGLGETGLDFHGKFRNRLAQEECFAAHLDLARELKGPVTVHCVKAWGRLIEILKEHPVPRVVLHAFGGSVELIPELITLNGWFSFGGAVLNPGFKRVRAAVAAVPPDRLLIETDSGDEPGTLIGVARAVAGLRGVSVEEIAERTFKNAQVLFGRTI